MGDRLRYEAPGVDMGSYSFGLLHEFPDSADLGTPQDMRGETAGPSPDYPAIPAEYRGHDRDTRVHVLDHMGENFLPRSIVEGIVALGPEEFRRLKYLVTFVEPEEMREERDSADG